MYTQKFRNTLFEASQTVPSTMVAGIFPLAWVTFELSSHFWKSILPHRVGVMTVGAGVCQLLIFTNLFDEWWLARNQSLLASSAISQVPSCKIHSFVSLSPTHHTHRFSQIYIYIYICICVYVCFLHIFEIPGADIFEKSPCIGTGIRN